MTMFLLQATIIALIISSGNTVFFPINQSRLIPLISFQVGQQVTTTVFPKSPNNIQTQQECSTLAMGCTNVNDCYGTPPTCNTMTTPTQNSPLTKCYWPLPPTEANCSMTANIPRCRCPLECPSVMGCTTEAACTGGCMADMRALCHWPPPGTTPTCAKAMNRPDCMCVPVS